MRERGNLFFHKFDRYVGIPLVFLAGVRVKRKLPKKIERIAILKSAGIGDLVVMSGIIHDMRTAFPDAKITLFTGQANRAMGELIEGVEVIALPIMKPWLAAKKIREQSFDVWIDGDPWPRISALLSRCSRAKFRIGFRTPGQCRHFAYDIAIEHSAEEHEVENLRRLVMPLGVISLSLPKLNIEEPKKKMVVLHQFPGGSRAALKMWDKWQPLADYLVKKGYRVVTTGGKADHSMLRGVENHAGKDSLLETCKLLSSAFCVITVDTGVMHLSGALSTFTLALHGPTSPKRWGALGKNVVALTPNIDYTPCIHLGFEATCKTSRCMRAITLQQVIEVFENEERKDKSASASRRERDEALAHLP
ncbi:MAG: glycosyltransferase family 9 protein [Chlamydiales bacterium]|nr:glycosyltransferase family 9 protein [Chlamydiales bacterium]